MNTQKINSYALLGSSDKEYPQLRILQTSSAPVQDNKAPAGKIYNSLTGEVFDKIDVVMIAVRREFRVWKDGDGLSKFPEYVSDNLQSIVHLNPETGEKIGEESLQESRVWQDRKSNPKAKTQYYFLAGVPGKTGPVFIRVGGLGYKRARRFLNKASTTGKQLYEFVTRIKVEEEPTKYGKKFVPEFEITDKKLPEEWSLEKNSRICQRFIAETRSLPAPQ